MQNIYQRLLQLRRIFSPSDFFALFFFFFLPLAFVFCFFYLSPRSSSDVSVQWPHVVLGLNPVTVGNWANSNDLLVLFIARNRCRGWGAVKVRHWGCWILFQQISSVRYKPVAAALYWWDGVLLCNSIQALIYSFVFKLCNRS